jgi:hypothetical protein
MYNRLENTERCAQLPSLDEFVVHTVCGCDANGENAGNHVRGFYSYHHMLFTAVQWLAVYREAAEQPADWIQPSFSR